MANSTGAIIKHGIHVPGWLVATVLAVIAVLILGFQGGTWWKTHEDWNADMEYRLCRIEQALEIPEWPACGELRRAHILDGSAGAN